MIKIASLKRTAQGMGVCQLWVLVWGLQRLFPCATFLTRSVRLHSTCIRLVWHRILIPMGKDDVIFTGTEIDDPFWPGWRVLRVSFCSCWQRAECSWESGTRITGHEQQLWLELSFRFSSFVVEFAAFEALLLWAEWRCGLQWHGLQKPVR